MNYCHVLVFVILHIQSCVPESQRAKSMVLAKNMTVQNLSTDPAVPQPS